MTANGIVGESRAPADAGTVVAAREIDVVPLAAKKICAVAADPFDTGPGILERDLGQLRKAFIEAGPVDGLATCQLGIAEQCRSVKFRRIAQT